MNRYIDERGRVGILISAQYGEGFSSVYGSRICFDPDLIQLRIDNREEEFFIYCKERYGIDPFCYRFDKMKIEWLERGTIFEIQNYDGYETIRIIRYPEDFLIA